MEGCGGVVLTLEIWEVKVSGAWIADEGRQGANLSRARMGASLLSHVENFATDPLQEVSGGRVWSMQWRLHNGGEGYGGRFGPATIPQSG